MARNNGVSLVLSDTVAGNYRATDPLSAGQDRELEHERRKVLERQDFTCQGCGFRSMHWQEVHHLDGNHKDNSRSNLATVCQFCHKVHHIGLAGEHQEGVLIWLPEISQAHLHHLVRACFIAERWHQVRSGVQRNRKTEQVEEMVGAAQSLMAALRARQEPVRKMLLTSDPFDLGNVLMEWSPEDYARRNQILWPIRLLPLNKHVIDEQDRMPEILDSWLSEGGPFVARDPGLWKAQIRA